MDYDVIVVGSGPSGSTAARQCALKGLKTLMLEKEKLPRYKPCGGGITPKAASLLDFKIKKELIEGGCFGTQLHYRDYKIEVRTPFKIISFVSRDKFDLYLAEKAVDAGVELRESERVKSVELTKDAVNVRTNRNIYKASAVIGADGVNSIVSRSVRKAFRPKELALSLEAQVPIKQGMIEDQDMSTIYMGYIPRGYGWVFPKEEHLSVGIYGTLSGFGNPKDVFANFLSKLNLDTNIEYHAHLIPFGGYDRTLYSDRILLVGDAAGFVDPLFGEGIPYAINSGRIAADTLVKAYEQEEFSRKVLKEYSNTCHSIFDTYLKDALNVSLLIYKHPTVFVKSIASNKPLLYKGLEIAAGRIDYKQFRKWFLIRIPYYCIRSLFL